MDDGIHSFFLVDKEGHQKHNCIAGDNIKALVVEYHVQFTIKAGRHTGNRLQEIAKISRC